METSNGSEPVVRDRQARGSGSRLSPQSSGLGGQARLRASGQAVAETVNVAAGIRSVHARRWWILAATALSTFVVALDNTVVDAALPSIARSFAAANSTLMWVVNGYVLALTGLLLLGGALGDRYGRKRLLATGTVIFGLGALGSALAPTAGVLIAMRALMGAGAAFMLPATLSIITNVFPREERARAIGVWSVSFALGVIVGPLLGGVLVDGFGWQAVFWTHLPIVALTLLGLRIVPESTDERRLRLDIPGAILGPVGITALVYAFIQGGDLGWTSVPIVTAFIAAGVFLIGFVAVERRSEAPMLRIEFFRQRDFTGPLLVVMVLFFAMVGVLFFFTLYLQLVQGQKRIHRRSVDAAGRGRIDGVRADRRRVSRASRTESHHADRDSHDARRDALDVADSGEHGLRDVGHWPGHVRSRDRADIAGSHRHRHGRGAGERGRHRVSHERCQSRARLGARHCDSGQRGERRLSRQRSPARSTVRSNQPSAQRPPTALARRTLQPANYQRRSPTR